jgi:hypothetical protein
VQQLQGTVARHDVGSQSRVVSSSHCGRQIKVIARIEAPDVIEKIFTRLDNENAPAGGRPVP